ncbi:MAG: alpha/beta hydrolase [bacterium]|nr:alpha/beta hydrolase [bacterium]
MKKFLLFLVLLFPIALNAQKLEGKWYSSFTVMGTSMRMNLKVTMSPELEVQISNPDMKDAKLNCNKATLDNDAFYFEVQSIGLEFNGTLSGDSIEGEMQQSGLRWDVTFKREEQEMALVNRPQEPKPPFPYSTDSLQIENGYILLGATLVLPENFNKSTPIVILTSGSGPQNRDCEIAGHKPFWVIADHLARNNIASIRFDDRGTGTSTGNYNEASLEDLASDVETIARHVRKKLKYKKNALGLMGHSEGGMHTIIAATNYKKIDFLIQLASTGTSGKQVLIQQQYDIPKAAGGSEELSTWNRDVYAGMVDIVLRLEQAEASDSLTQFLSSMYDSAPTDFDKTTTQRLQFIMGNIQFVNNPWMRQFLTFTTSDYFDALEKRELPILAIHGEKDIQVAPESNSAGFDDYEYAELEIIQGLNHLMQSCNDCTIQEYGALEETISPTVLHFMSDWIQELH